MKERNCYIVNRGFYIGRLLILVNIVGFTYNFLLVYGSHHIPVSLTHDEFSKNLKSDHLGFGMPLISFIEEIPEEHFKVIEAQYNYERQKSTSVISDLKKHNNIIKK